MYTSVTLPDNLPVRILGLKIQIWITSPSKFRGGVPVAEGVVDGADEHLIGEPRRSLAPSGGWFPGCARWCCTI